MKKIELRKWNTKFRGDFLIHASKTSDKMAMERFGFSELPCGFIVGKVKLVDVKKYNNEQEHQNQKNNVPPHLSRCGLIGTCFLDTQDSPRIEVRGFQKS